LSGTTRSAWEYRIEAGADAARLDALGQDGWELAAIDGGAFYFKRPRPSFTEQVTLDQRERVFAARAPREGDRAAS
jgi:hypothetical protein